MRSKDPPLETTVHTIRVADQSLSYRTVGTGQPLVLVHGYAASGHMWQLVLPYLAQHYQVFVVDLPGHGRSPLTGTWRLREVAPLLIRWLQEMRLPPVSLMGHSMGGAICIQMAAAAPEILRSVILADSAGLPLNAHLPKLVVRSVRSALQPGNGRYPMAMIRDMVRPRPRLWWQCARELVESDFSQEAARISAPTLIIWGGRDVMIPINVGHTLNKAIPHASFEIIESCGHRSMIGQPDTFSKVVLDFLSRTAQ